MDLPYDMDLLYDIKTSEELWDKVNNGYISKHEFEDMIDTLIRQDTKLMDAIEVWLKSMSNYTDKQYGKGILKKALTTHRMYDTLHRQ